MAAGDVSVVINSETKAFRMGVESGIIRPLEDAEKAIEDLGRSRGPEQLEDDLRQAQRRTEELADETKDTARQIERSYRDAGRGIGLGLDDGFDKAKAGADDFKQEAGSSIRETAASISSVEDALDAVQEIAANAFAGFGPVGAGAGLVAALGLGLVLENLRQQGEAADEMKRRWSEAYAQAADDGRAFLDQQQILAEANDLQFNPDRVNEYNQAVKDAAALNLDINDVLLARAGDEESLQVVIGATQQKYNEVFADFARARSVEANELVQIKDRYTALGDEQSKNVEKAQNSQKLRDQLHEQEREQIARTHQALLGMQQLGPFRPLVVPQIDWRSVQDLERRLANGMRVSVTAVNGGRVPV